MNPRNGNYGRGFGDFFAYRDLLERLARRGRPRRAGAAVSRDRRGTQRVVVVTGGGGGIGAAIADELGRRGAFVVTVDPLVSARRVRAARPTEETTAGRIVAAGGAARASAISVTDATAVATLFDELVDEHGRLDAVVNVAGITRPTASPRAPRRTGAACSPCTSTATATSSAPPCRSWRRPAAAAILGVTSGSGWRSADAGAYGCAKRAVAAAHLAARARRARGRHRQRHLAHRRHPHGHRRAGPRRSAASGAGSAATGGLSLGSMPEPEQLGPLGAHLVGDVLAWSGPGGVRRRLRGRRDRASPG